MTLRSLAIALDGFSPGRTSTLLAMLGLIADSIPAGTLTHVEVLRLLTTIAIRAELTSEL